MFNLCSLKWTTGRVVSHLNKARNIFVGLPNFIFPSSASFISDFSALNRIVWIPTKLVSYQVAIEFWIKVCDRSYSIVTKH